MNEDDFKKMCPNLYKAIMDNRKQYEIYGIKFMSHSDLKIYEIRNRVEDLRAFIYFTPKSINEFYITLN